MPNKHVGIWFTIRLSKALLRPSQGPSMQCNISSNPYHLLLLLAGRSNDRRCEGICTMTSVMCLGGMVQRVWCTGVRGIGAVVP